MMPHAARAHVLSLGRCPEVHPVMALRSCAVSSPRHGLSGWHESTDGLHWGPSWGLEPLRQGPIVYDEAGGHPEPGVYLPKPVVRARRRP